MRSSPPRSPEALAAWCERERTRIKQAEEDRWQREVAQERARRYWEYGVNYGAEIWEQNMPILVIVEHP